MTDALAALPAAIAAVAPRLSADAAGVWLHALVPPMRASGIVTPNRIAMFLGQCAEETGGFQTLTEDLWYSAERMCEVWPGRFPTLADAAPYAHNPQALANRVYADRLGNGDESTGDGWRFRGAGLIQVTGRWLYEQFARAVGRSAEDVAAWILTPEGAAASACWYWSLAKINPLADAWDIPGVTRKINGGLGNLPERQRLCAAARAVLGTSPPPVTADDLNAAEIARIA